jgi:acyl carrier protein/GNAT superfamily N-acetyltransferase
MADPEAMVRQRVLDTLQRIAPNLALAELNPGAPLRDQIELDSIDWLNFIGALQDAFAIDIPEADYGRLATLRAIVDYLGLEHAVSRGRRRRATHKHYVVGGARVTIRPIRTDDADRVRGLLQASSDESRYKRFQKWIEAPSNTLVHFLTDLDPRRGVALVASVPVGSGEQIVAEARCLATSDGKSCEVGLLVEDAWQKTGLAGLLMQALIDATRNRGFAAMEGIVLASNASMLRFARALGFEIESVEEDRTTLRIYRRLQPEPARTPQA